MEIKYSNKNRKIVSHDKWKILYICIEISYICFQ